MPRIIPSPVALRFWGVTLAALLGVAVTLALGRWQLSRATQKEVWNAAIEARRDLPPLTGAAWLRQYDTAELLHRPVRLEGRFLAQHTIFLDNRQMHGRPGFFVLTPFVIEGGQQAVVVQRGWTPRNFLERDALPRVPTPTGTVTLAGRISPAPGKLFDFGGADDGRIRQNLDLTRYGSQIGRPLPPVTVLQTASAEDAGGPVADQLLRDWPALTAGVQMHYGYAFQWFGLSALIAFLYVWYQFLLPRRQRRRV